MYDRFTDSITGPGGGKASIASPASSIGSASSRRSSSSLSTSVKTGMSVMALAQLLAPPKSNSKGSASGLGSVRFDDEDDDDFNHASDEEDESRTLDEDAQQQRRRRRARRELQRKAKELEELERNYKNAVFNPPREKKEPRFLPPSDQSTGQLIDKYRKLAVGKLPGADDSQEVY